MDNREHHSTQAFPASISPNTLENTLQARATLKRQTINSVAPSFAEHPTIYKKLMSCSETITVKGSKITHHQRCKHRLCSLCQHIEASKRIAETKEAIEYLHTPLFDDPEADDYTGRCTALKITLTTNSPRPISELRRTIKALHSSWTNLISRASIKPYVTGYQRATEITIKKDTLEPLVHPHIHCVLLLKVEANETPLQIEHFTQDAIKQLWPKIIEKQLQKQGLSAETTRTCAQDISPLWARTNKDLLAWLTYTLKGLTPTLTPQELPPENPAFWTMLSEAIHGIRLVARGGELREMLIDYADTQKARRPKKRRTMNIKPTHIWSRHAFQWLPIREHPRIHAPSPIAPRCAYNEMTTEELNVLIKRTLSNQRIERYVLRKHSETRENGSCFL